MSIKSLYEQRQKLVAEARERLDLINDNTDEARGAELEASHDKAMAQVDAIDAKIEREEKMARIEARAADAELEAREARRPVVDAAPVSEGVDYRSAFHNWLKVGGDRTQLDAESRSVLEARAQSTTAAAGGYTVPVELQNMIVKAMAAYGPMYGDVAMVLNTSAGHQITIPTVDDTSVTAGDAVHTESADFTDDGGKDVTFAQKVLDSYVFDTEFVRFSFELAQDSIFNVEALLADLLAERLGRKANAILTTGTGSSQPNGIVTAASAGLTAAATGAITADELIDLEHSIDPAYRGAPGFGFMFNDSTLAAIRKLKDGQGNYLWAAGNYQQGVPGTINGRTYYINQAMADIGTSAVPVIAGDFKKYIVRKVGGVELGVMRERFWPNMGIAGYVRLDGEIADSRAIKKLTNAAS
jgi:HK97 family phage major capsid protein